MTVVRKLELYLRASFALRGGNFRGLPIIPKWAIPLPVYNRAAYNEFITWIHRLGLLRAQTVVDIGANHGDFAEAVSAYFPHAEVLLVEPLTQLASELLMRGRTHHGKWSLEQSAVGAEVGELPLHISDDADTTASLVGFGSSYRQIKAQSAIRQVACKVKPLDLLLAERKIGHIDLLKIDVEGFEFEVMKGASDSLARTEAIVVEVSLIRRGSDARSALLKMLEALLSHGFELVDIIPSLFGDTPAWRPVEFNILARRISNS